MHQPVPKTEDATAEYAPARIDIAVGADAGAVQLEPLGERGYARREPHPPASISNLGDRIFALVTTGFAGLIVAILGTMLVILAYQGRLSMAHFGLSFLTGTTWDPIHGVFGGAPAILGTVYTSLLALFIAAPIALLVAIFLTELAPRWMRFGLGFLVELLAAVPSIVYGLWALFVLVPLVSSRIEPPLIQHFGNSPLFSGYPLGLGIFTASLILAVMILPTITAISRDVMLAVPNNQRDAMLALGATRWETTWKVVVPYARSGIIGAIILGLGRAVGETMAAQMVIGNREAVTGSLFQPGTTMAATIVNQLQEASDDLHRSALIELALILMLVTLVLNAVARLLVWRVTASPRLPRTGGAATPTRVGKMAVAGNLLPALGGLARAPRRAGGILRSSLERSLGSTYAVRNALNRLGAGLALLCLVLAIIPLGAMLGYVFAQGASSLSLSFFTQLPVPAGETGGGMSNAILGTLELIPLACAVGLPIGIMSGIYLSRTGAGRFAQAVRFVTDVVAGTPSIVAGVVAYVVVVIPFGYSAVAGSIALGLLMFPTVTRATEEAIKLVPAPIREAALALGLPEWKAMLRIILPAATNGIVTAIMLGIARVAGETAPLYFTIFGSPNLPGSPLKPVHALPLQIWLYATGPYAEWHREAWAGAFVLFSLVVGLNLAARLLTYRLVKRMGTA